MRPITLKEEWKGGLDPPPPPLKVQNGIKGAPECILSHRSGQVDSGHPDLCATYPNAPYAPQRKTDISSSHQMVVTDPEIS
jgi:hypothetical protein